jgi:hypothetical protein
MIWHHYPHLPEIGSKILVKYKGCEENNLFPLNVREWEGLRHIEKWCFYEDFKEEIERKLRNRC